MEEAGEHMSSLPGSPDQPNKQTYRARFFECSSKIFTRQLIKAVALGQCLSLFICGTAVTSGLLQRQGVNIPTAQSFLNYVLLCLTYTTWLACRRGDQNIVQVLRQRWWKYFLLAVIDVEANYLVVKAYQYTTVTSVQLLDCFTIPVVLVLSRLVLKVRYRCIHLTGVGLCLVGVGSLILADVLVQRFGSDQSNDKLFGDILCLLGATLYGISNVGQEVSVRSFDRVEFLGMIGMFASVINGIQFAILERHEIANVNFSAYQTLLPLLGFALCLYLLYSCMPVVIAYTSATSVNLNLLSADFYSLLFGLFLFKDQFHFLYFISFGLIITGVIVYTVRPPRPPDENSEMTEMESGETESVTASSSQGLLSSGNQGNTARLSSAVKEKSVQNSGTLERPVGKTYETLLEEQSTALAVTES